MTIKELIEELQKHPQEMKVCVDGYEGGFDDIKVIITLNIAHTSKAPEYEGRYQLAENIMNGLYRHWAEPGKIQEEKVLILSR